MWSALRGRRLVDDDDVALIHGPAEAGWAPLTEAMVNVGATLDAAVAASVLASAEAAGIAHPALITPDDIDLLYGHNHTKSLTEVIGYEPGWGQPSKEDIEALDELMHQPPPPIVDLGTPHPGWAADRS